MLSLQRQTAEDDLPWECVAQFENVDWNDILDAEESGDTEALQLLMNNSKKLQEQEEPIAEISSRSCQSSLSYAQAVGSAYQGIKRTVSDRYNVSPLDRDANRSAKYSRISRGCDSSPFSEVQLMDLAATPLTHSTPDVDSHHKKGTSVYAQRRLFSSPNNDEQPTTKTSPGQPLEKLTSHRLCQRQKQLDFGKNTVGYQRYIQTIPKWQRKPTDPVTPDKNRQSSTRAWQGQVRHWRRALHVYDDPEAQETFTVDEAALCEI